MTQRNRDKFGWYKNGRKFESDRKIQCFIFGHKIGKTIQPRSKGLRKEHWFCFRCNWEDSHTFFDPPITMTLEPGETKSLILSFEIPGGN